MEGYNVRYMEQVLQTQSNYEPLREDELESESVHSEGGLHTAEPIGIVNEPEPTPQRDDDDSILEQQLGEMNVARGRAVEAMGNRLELAQEGGDEAKVIALEGMLNEYTSM